MFPQMPVEWFCGRSAAHVPPTFWTSQELKILPQRRAAGGILNLWGFSFYPLSENRDFKLGAIRIKTLFLTRLSL